MAIEYYDTDEEGNLIDRREGSKDEREAARAAIGWTPERGVEAGQTFVPNMRRWVAGQGWVEPLSSEENPDLGAGYWTDPVTGINTYISGEVIAPIDRLPGEEDPYDKWERWKRDENIKGAKAVIRSFLERFGLGALTKIAMGWAESGMSQEAMLVELRYGNDPTVRQVYDTKFPAMALRKAGGFRAINEAEYLDLERGILQIANRAGIDNEFLGMDAETGVTGITALIGGDVSLAEWRDRVALGEEAKNNADDTTIELLQSRYGFGEGDIVSAMLDPTKTKNIVDARRQFGAAGLASQSQKALGPQNTFSKDLSDELQRLNVQGREIAARVSPLKGLTANLLNETGLTADQIGEGAFGIGTGPSTVGRTQQRRGAAFKGDTGLLTTQTGVTGYGTATQLQQLRCLAPPGRAIQYPPI